MGVVVVRCERETGCMGRRGRANLYYEWEGRAQAKGRGQKAQEELGGRWTTGNLR